MERPSPPIATGRRPPAPKASRSTCSTPGKPTNRAATSRPCRRQPGYHSWTSDVEPGSLHDLTVARDHVLSALYWTASQLDLPTHADGGYDGAGIGGHTPVKQPAGSQRLDIDTRTRNTLLRGLRCLGERGFAIPTRQWHALHHFTTSPRKIGTIVKASLVLTQFEHRMIK